MITQEKLDGITSAIGRYTTAIQALAALSASTDVTYSIALSAEDLKVSMGLGENMQQVMGTYDRFVMGSDRKLNTVTPKIYERWAAQLPPFNLLRSLGVGYVNGDNIGQAPENIGPTAGKFGRGLVSKENSLVGNDTDFQIEVTMTGPSIRNVTGPDQNYSLGAMGVVIGYVTNSDGTIDYLSVVRNTGDWGSHPRFGLYLNLIDFDTPNIPLVGTSAGLTELDWNTDPVKLRVTLSGSTLTLETTLPGSTTYVAAAKLTYAYTADTTLQKIKNSRRFGYTVIGDYRGNGNDQSVVDQLYTWNTSILRTTTKPIMDLVNNVVYKFVNNAWAVESGTTPATYLKPGKQYMSVGTRKLVYIDKNLAGTWLR
jgi:hypothetical protein